MHASNEPKFEITNVEIHNDYDGNGPAISAEVNGTQFLEWICKGNKVERTDSHIRINQTDDIKKIFNVEEWDAIDIGRMIQDKMDRALEEEAPVL
jgi:hypothetical protein